MYFYLLLFIALIVTSMPIGFSMIVSTIIFLIFYQPIDLVLVPQKMLEGLDSFTLLAVPFYILLGALMDRTGITERFVRFATTLVGHVRGGLAHVTIVSEMLLSGVTGSAVSDAAALGAIVIPSMTKAGYSKAFSAALTSAAAALGPIIPPSILMVVYGAMANVSIGRLFLGGAIPGILMAVYLMITVYIISRRRNYGSITRRVPLSEVGHAFVGTIFPLMVPVIIVVGILGGIFTATESGAVALLYLLIAAPLRLGGMKLTLKDFLNALGETINLLGAVFFIIAAANLFGWVLNVVKFGDALTSFLLSISTSRVVILLMVSLLLLILGCFVETFALLIMFTPVFVPMMGKLGVDPLHFGLIIMLNLTIGLSTPPVGMTMFVAVTIAKITVDEFIKEAWPFILALIAALLLIIFIPELTLVLPNLLLPEK